MNDLSTFHWYWRLRNFDEEGIQTKDSNSAYMAKFCFSLGINLKRIEVIGDDESEIIEAVKRMSDNYDFVVTSGGIGPSTLSLRYFQSSMPFQLTIVL